MAGAIQKGSAEHEAYLARLASDVKAVETAVPAKRDEPPKVEKVKSETKNEK